MKRKNLFLILSLLLTIESFGQVFQKVLQNDNFDHNHYSIENAGAYQIIGGTIFNGGTLLGTNTHIAKIVNGTIVWEKTYDLGYYYDGEERCLDIELGPDGDIYATGYIEDGGIKKMFALHLDANGNSILFRTFDDIPLPYPETIGLKVHYSIDKDELLIAGYQSTNFNDITLDSSPKDAIVIALDPLNSLLTLWETKLNSVNTNGYTNFDIAKDIIDIPNTGYVITGSATTNSNTRDALCVMINYTGSILHNYSGTGGNEKAGVTSLYDQTTDQLYILANQWTTFEIVEVNGATTPTPTFSNAFENLMYRPDYYNSNVLAFDMEWSNNNDNIVIAGYLHNDVATIPYNSPFFMKEIQRDGSLIWGKLWNSPNVGYDQHDESYLQAFNISSNGLNNNPEQFCKANGGYLRVSYRKDGGSMNVELIQTDNTGNADLDCQENINYEVNAITRCIGCIEISAESSSHPTSREGNESLNTPHEEFYSCNRSSVCILNDVTFQAQNIDCNLFQFMSFINPSNDPNYEYDWDFGDGTFSNDPNPQHMFPPGGPCQYFVCLTVTYNNGLVSCSKDFCTTIQMPTMAHCPPCLLRMKDNSSSRNTNELEINVLPNPTSNTISIQLSEIIENAEIIIYNIQGSKVKKQQVNNENNIVNLSTLENGMYFYRIFQNDKRISSGKIQLIK